MQLADRWGHLPRAASSVCHFLPTTYAAKLRLWPAQERKAGSRKPAQSAAPELERKSPPSKAKLVMITGLSGSGRSPR